MKPDKDDFDGLEKAVTVGLKSPYIHFKPEKVAIIGKYKALVDAFAATVENFITAVESIGELVDQITEFPGKIEEASSAAYQEIAALDFGEKVKAGKNIASAILDAKKCCQMLIADLNNVKEEFEEIKETATTV